MTRVWWREKIFGVNSIRDTDIERCMALGYQLAELLKGGFLKEYLEADQGEPQGKDALRDPSHEAPVQAELNSISGGFFGGRNSATKGKRYVRFVMTLEERDHNDTPDPDLCFSKADLI